MPVHLKIFKLILISILLTSCSNAELIIDHSDKRTFHPTIDGHWIGNGISYSPYRDGEGPDKESLTTKANILQDLLMVSKRWNLIRLYAADQQSENVLSVILEHSLPIRVMQGAWISGHQTDAENDQQISELIRMAREYADIVVAVNVGNEIFVDWSWHRVDDMGPVIEFIRRVRAQITQPVTVSDDYNFWNKPQAMKIANEVDFIGLHAYAFWNNKTIDEALSWSQGIYADISQRYPDKIVAYTETGWPTNRVYDDSYEGQLIGKANEQNQQHFLNNTMPG